jgi:hypothetical protein
MIPLALVVAVPVIGGQFETHFLLMTVMLSVTAAPLIGLFEASDITISKVSKTCFTHHGLAVFDDVRLLVANLGVGRGGGTWASPR